jgi:hypothetical protein
LTYAQNPRCGAAEIIGGCYKTNSVRKSLIFNKIFSCRFFGHSSESLDLSRLGEARCEAINKVIHSFKGFWSNRFEINHLSGVSETDLNTMG